MRLFSRNRIDPPLPDVPPVLLGNGQALPVELRFSARASRLALRLHPALGAVELVLPHGVSVTKALAFLNSRRGWVAAQAARLPPRIAFADGAIIPVLGTPHVLRAIGRGTGAQPPFQIGDGLIEVTGAPDHLARRTRAGLRDHARQLLSDKTATLAAGLGKPIGRIAIGDARTRWGSCASSGNIKYSWRLVLSPEAVMDYVVAHEVAHLAVMNHSPRFWRVVDELYGDPAQERAWLRRHGPQLLRYG